jgi:hypothetical protein
LKDSSVVKWFPIRPIKDWVAILGFFFLLFLSGCRSLGSIETVRPGVYNEIERCCRTHFLTRPWQFIQSVTAYTPDGEVRNAISVTRIHPKQGRIKCVITSIQGIVLFDGEYDQKFTILRAIPPFDDEKFARTMFEDIRLVFFSPDVPTAEVGKTSSGAPICRYELNDGFIEVIFQEDGQREIRRYNRYKKLLKIIEACYEQQCSQHISESTGVIPAKLTIHHCGLLKYQLELELMGAQALEAD